jgi:hypothetical protein
MANSSEAKASPATKTDLILEGLGKSAEHGALLGPAQKPKPMPDGISNTGFSHTGSSAPSKGGSK